MTSTAPAGATRPEWLDVRPAQLPGHVGWPHLPMQTCPGNCAGRTSNHSGRVAPAGAVDVTDYPAFAALMKRSPHRPRLLNDLPVTDPNHFSATGH